MRQIPSGESFSAEALTPLERRLCDWLAYQRDAMIALLAEVANIDGGSGDKAGVDAVGKRFRQFLAGRSVETDIIARDTFSRRSSPVASRSSARPCCCWDMAPRSSERARRLGRVSGNVVSERKSGTFLRFRIKGRSAHAGVDFTAGVSAISELAHRIFAMDAITDIRRDVTPNAGLVSGGQSVNATTPDAGGGIDLSYNTLRDRRDALNKFEDLVARNRAPAPQPRWRSPASSSPFSRRPNRPACSNVTAGPRAILASTSAPSTLAAAPIPVSPPTSAPLCFAERVLSTGVAHTWDEYIELDTLVPRAQAAALTRVQAEPEDGASSNTRKVLRLACALRTRRGTQRSARLWRDFVSVFSEREKVR